jgi:hypothetical protein
MIVRISGEDQYRLADGERETINELENAVVSAVEGNREQEFHETYEALLTHVRENGQRVGDEELEGSDLILPPADLTLAEAGADFTGDGLIPD